MQFLKINQIPQLAFEILAFSKTERQNVYEVTAGVMHMGELKFKQQGREEQAQSDAPAVKLKK